MATILAPRRAVRGATIAGMATLDDLRTTLLPAAVAAAPIAEAAAAREIAWVRVLRSRVPALDALEPGDVVIAPAAVAAAVARTPGDAAALAEALGGRAAALLVTGQDARGRHGARSWKPQALPGSPSCALPGADAAALERSVIAWLVNRRAALEEQAAGLERRLEQLALAGADLAALVAAFGGFLGRAAVLEGRRGDALAVHAPAEIPAAAAAASRFLATGGGVALRVPLPLAPADPSRRPDLARYGEPALRGSLVLLGDAPVERPGAHGHRSRGRAARPRALAATRPCSGPGRRPGARRRCRPTARRGSSSSPARSAGRTSRSTSSGRRSGPSCGCWRRTAG